MVEALSRDAATQLSVRALGLIDGDFAADEVLAELLRRAASFVCPTTRSQLLRATFEPIRLLVLDADLVRAQLDDLLEALVALGDLVEAPDLAGGSSGARLLFLGPPSFIERRGGALVLLGIRPEADRVLGEDSQIDIRLERHLRYVDPGPHVGADTLEEYGLRRVPEGHWLRPPQQLTPSQLILDYDQRLAAEGNAGEISGLRILDPESAVTYYRGRWRAVVPSDHGNFVARRPQAFGADLWCYVELDEGAPRRLIDLPVSHVGVSGFDEACRLQAAIDSERGHPQVFRLGPLPDAGDRVAIKLLSPPPRWLQRRWDLLGVARSIPGAIVSYVFPEADLEEEIQFARDMLWLETER